MSERKVLNKYYPPDFDPNKIPKLRRPKTRQFNIRIMAPFNMRCGTCGEYIYKGKKFNSRQERVEDEDYLGLMIFRFYIKCPRCVSEISFKTDPKNTDYELEAGATRNFEAARTAEILAEREMKEKEAEEKDNPMKVLENRTKSSRQEMEMIETLEELRELNSRHAKVDHENMILLHKAYEEQLSKLQDEEDEEFIRSVFGKSSSGESVKRIHDDDDDDDDDSLSSASSTPKVSRLSLKPSDILMQDTSHSADSKDTIASETSTGSSLTTKTRPAAPKNPAVWQKSVGGLSSKNSLVGLVKKKVPSTSSTSSNNTSASNAAPKQTSKETTPESPDKPIDSSSSKTTDKKIVEVAVESKPVSVTTTSTGQSGLGLLGAYSDSESDSS